MRFTLLVLACAHVACSADDGSTFDAGADVDATTSGPDGGPCTVFCQAPRQPAAVDVRCVPASVTSASVDGPCALSAAANSPGCSADAGLPPFGDCGSALVYPDAGGDCNLHLGFADGFVFSGTVHFGVVPATRCCPEVYVPSPAWLVVEEPDAGCADASPE